MTRKIFLIGIICINLVLIGCTSNLEVVINPEDENPIEDEVIEEILPEFVEIQISGVGDIMVHGPQLRAQYDSASKTYNFDNNFKYISPYFQEADLMLGNLETTFGGEVRGFSSYPMFNTPDQLAESLKKAGFHAVSTANNHSFDTGKEGMIRTLDVLRDEGLKTFGTRKDITEDSFVVMDVKGIKVGLSSYTYETPMQAGQRAINAMIIPKDVQPLIDTFSYELLEEDLASIQERVKQMKEQGAELIVFYMHWGNEYHRQPNQYQRAIAQELSNYGVDIIFGSHPHVLQPIEVIESELDGSQTAVIYSMGNFLSNQRYEILDNRYTEDGIIVNVRAEKNLLTNEIVLKEITYVPTWVHRYFVEGKTVYEIVPTYDAVKEPEQYGINSSQSLWRVENSHQNTLTIIESLEPTDELRLSPTLFSKED
ncbi:CapA family protein [Alkaliphilus transvaalensis]|uniref:CapA family protein n=1 Tax=Alkaliphilus transvaalensis TaxID=114628 RepID=UPI00047D395B|nr:CapA family protein [Alkaliphilus transvaalensis]